MINMPTNHLDGLAMAVQALHTIHADTDAGRPPYIADVARLGWGMTACGMPTVGVSLTGATVMVDQALTALGLTTTTDPYGAVVICVR